MRHLLIVLVIFAYFLTPTGNLGAQTLLFEENFDDGTADGFTPDCSLWQVNADGRYEIEDWGFEINHWSRFGSPLWGDFHLTLDMLTHDSVHNTVAFRIQENDDRYELVLRGEPYKDVHLFKWVNGVDELIHFSSFSNTLSEWHHLEVLAEGDRLVFWVDGQEAFDLVDTAAPYLSGSMALVSYTGGVAQHQLLQVDNVLVVNPVVNTEPSYLDRLKALYR